MCGRVHDTQDTAVALHRGASARRLMFCITRNRAQNLVYHARTHALYRQYGMNLSRLIDVMSDVCVDACVTHKTQRWLRLEASRRAA